MLEDYNWQLTRSRYSHGPGLSSNWSFCWVENCLVKGSAKPKSKTIAPRHSANASHCWVFCAARLNSETFFAKFNHFKLAHILHSRRTLQAWFFNGQMPTGNKTWKMWARLLCLTAPAGGAWRALMIVKHCIEQQKVSRGWGRGGRPGFNWRSGKPFVSQIRGVFPRLCD